MNRTWGLFEALHWFNESGGSEERWSCPMGREFFRQHIFGWPGEYAAAVRGSEHRSKLRPWMVK